jgi:hypothetical protein
MADLTRSNFTVLRTWYEGDKGGKDTVKCLLVEITSGTAGGGTNTIPASVFGLSEIFEVTQRGADNVDPGNYLFMPAYDGQTVIAINVEQGTDANRGDAADVAFETFPTKLIVKGVE